MQAKQKNHIPCDIETIDDREPWKMILLDSAVKILCDLIQLNSQYVCTSAARSDLNLYVK